MIKKLDYQFDNVIKSHYVTAKVTYSYAIEHFVPLINKLPFQRNPQRASFYKRLEQDIIDGCIMPNITLAIDPKTIGQDINQITDENSLEFITKNLQNAFVLDGIQRLTTLNRIKTEPNFPNNGVLYCNIVLSDSMDKLLYRMITLNNGQKPMTTRHQVEILAANIFNFDELPILILTEKDKTKLRGTSEAMSKEVVIKGYLAYISNSIDIDNQKIIERKMDELIAEKIMESNIPEKKQEFVSVMDYVSEKIKDDSLLEWFKIPNNFIGFCAAMNQSFENFIELDSIQFKILINKFEGAFDYLDISRIKLGIVRRKLVKFYFNGNYADLSENQLIEKFLEKI